MHTQHDRTPSFSGRTHSHTTSKLQTNDIAYRQPTASILSDRLMLRLYIFCILFVSASRSQQMYVYSDYWFVLFARYSEVCQIGCTLFHCIYWGKRHRIMHIWALLYCVTFSPPTEYFFLSLLGDLPNRMVHLWFGTCIGTCWRWHTRYLSHSHACHRCKRKWLIMNSWGRINFSSRSS